MSLRDLTKNTFILALPKIISFFLKIIRAKLNAVILGTEGVGIVNQLNEVITKLGLFSTLSLNIGAKKLIIDFDKDQQKRMELPKIVGLFGLILITLVAVFFIIGLFYLEELSEFFLKDQSKGLFITAFLVFPIVTVLSVPKTTLAGLMEFKTLSRVEIIVKVTSFIIYIPLIIIFGVRGAVANLVITNLFFFAILSYFTFYKVAKKRGHKLISFKKPKVEKSVIREFLTISSVTSILGIYGIFSNLATRGIVASNLGMEQIGIYTPIIAWSGFFSSFFVPALLNYMFPRYGRCETNEELITVSNNGIRLVSFMILPFVAILIAFSDVLIPVFYSKKFVSATTYLPLHFIGIFFITWMRVLKQIMIPTGRVKQFIPFSIAESSLYLLVVFIFIDPLGLWAWALRFSLVPLVIFFSHLIFLMRTIKFKIQKQNALLMAYGILTSGIIYYFTLTTDNLYLLRG
ncbi:MAG: oligosaccharide flippase family protein, partial [bacterium]